MDNREKSGRFQPEGPKTYTLDELLEAIEPQYQAYKATMRRCISGLTGQAARLTAQGQEEGVSQLRRLCIEIAEFWGLTEDDTPQGYQAMAEQIGSIFDHAVSAARDLSYAPELSEQAKQDILDGLALYAQEMRDNDEKLEVWAVECEILAEELEEQWRLDAAAPQQTVPQMDGMMYETGGICVEQMQQTLKLYMPMTVGYLDGGCPEEIVMGSQEAAEYAPEIISALDWERREMEEDGPEEAERGLMAYYYEEDSVEEKVQSCHFTAEVRDRQLWGVAVCRVQGELTEDELERLKEHITGQASDGFGEGFEQREIPVADGLEIYPHLWQRRGWSIQTEQEQFGQQLGGMVLG